MTPPSAAPFWTPPPSNCSTLSSPPGHGERFVALDALFAHLTARAFKGKPTVELTKAKSATKLDSVAIAGATAAHRQLLDDHYRLERQEARGAWFLPREVTLKYGLANLAATIATQPRFAVNVARDATAKVDLRNDPDALAVWTLVVPLFSDLLAPIDLRTATGKLATPEQQHAAWEAVDATYADLGIDVADQLSVMRYGGGWGKLRIDDQVAAKQALVAALAGQVTADTTRRWHNHQRPHQSIGRVPPFLGGRQRPWPSSIGRVPPFLGGRQRPWPSRPSW